MRELDGRNQERERDPPRGNRSPFNARGKSPSPLFGSVDLDADFAATHPLSSSLLFENQRRSI